MDGTARKFRERNLDGVSLKYLDVGAVLESCRSDGTLPSKLLQNLSNSDLLPGIYEGKAERN